MADAEHLLTPPDGEAPDEQSSEADVGAVLAAAPRTVCAPARGRLFRTSAFVVVGALAAGALVGLVLLLRPKPGKAAPGQASALFATVSHRTSAQGGLRASNEVAIKEDPYENMTILESLGKLANASFGKDRLLGEPLWTMPHPARAPARAPRQVKQKLSGDEQAAIADCVIDITQSAAYLGQIALGIRTATSVCPKKDLNQGACAATVSGIIAQVGWIVSYLSYAATSCSNTINAAASCAGTIAWLPAALAEFSFAASATSVDCTVDWAAVKARVETLREKHGSHADAAAKVPALPAHLPKIRGWSPGPLAQKKAEWENKTEVFEFLYGKLQERADRQAAISACVFDGVQASSYIVRAALQIRAAAAACPQPQECAIEVMNVISSFAWISQFLAMMVSDCPEATNRKALCAADISDLVAASASMGAVFTGIGPDCSPDVLVAGGEVVAPGD